MNHNLQWALHGGNDYAYLYLHLFQNYVNDFIMSLLADQSASVKFMSIQKEDHIKLIDVG